MPDPSDVPHPARGASFARSLREALLSLVIAALCLGGFCAVIVRIVRELAALSGA